MEPPEGGGVERRRYHRRFIQFPLRYRRAGMTGASWQTTLLINISENGLFMTAAEALQLDNLLDIEFTPPGRTELIQVRSITRKTQSFRD